MGKKDKFNLLIVVLDCLRCDSFERNMPRTRRLLSEHGFFRFTNHWSVAHCSDPNFAALLTGFGPWETDITTQMGGAFKEEFPTLFWRWKRETGGTTWAVEPLFVPNFYKDHVDLLAWHKGTDSADLELWAARKFLSECEPGKPWLGFFRDMTAHYSYLDLPMPPRGSGGEIRPQYDAAVAHVDQFVHNLIEFIQVEHPRTAIAICSDHGEMLGETYGRHGPQYDHLWSLHNVLVRTPMALYAPGLSGKKTNRPTNHTDLMPTLCDLFGWQPQGEGVSWAPWLRGETTHPTPANRTLRLQGTGAGPANEAQLEAKGGMAIDPGLGKVLWRMRGVVQGSHKLVENIHADGGREMLLTKSGDYAERRYLKTTNVKHRLAKLLPPIPEYHDWEQTAVTKLTAQRKRGDAVILKRLEALGYT